MQLLETAHTASCT